MRIELTKQEVIYGFSADQKEQLDELLSPQYDDMWNSLIYGYSTDTSGDGTGNTQIISVAASQLGNVNGQPYWTWYGFSSRIPWCAIFVSWCANQSGYIEKGIIPKFSFCDDGIAWFKQHNEWQPQGIGYAPKAGDIIFFNWNADNEADHVGIVESVSNGKVNTIEGNTSNMVARRHYDLTDNDIMGYGTPAYQNESSQ